MKIKATECGNMCEVRLLDRRIRVYRLRDKTWALSFVRPAKPCAGCPDRHNLQHMVYKGRGGRTVMTGLKMSGEAMVGVMNAVMTLIEFERAGVEVRG